MNQEVRTLSIPNKNNPPHCAFCQSDDHYTVDHPRQHPIDAAADRQFLRSQFSARIAKELDHAYAKHGADQWGRHEFYGVLKEEVDELWDDIKSDSPQDTLEKELVQVAAMCFRYFETRDRYREPQQGVRHG